MRDVLPAPVFDAIQGHLRARAEGAESGWDAASEDEDTLTGDFCGALRTKWHEVRTDEGLWRWRVTYKKFRGRGPKAFEKEFGADGIVQVEVHEPDGEISTKGVLFQAKKAGASSRRDLPEQIRKMEGIAPNGSAVFEFGPDRYRAAPGAIVLTEINSSAGRVPRLTEPIGDYLGGEFLPCKSGIRGMYFDAVRKVLVVPSAETVRIIPIALRHRLRMDVVHESQFERAEDRLRR